MGLYTEIIYAKIIETTEFSIIESYLQEADINTLVIFDIDEVIIETKDSILKPQNKAHFLKMEEELLTHTSNDEALYFRSIIYQEQEIELVDARILDILNSLKNKGINTTAITYIATGPRGKIARFEDWGLSRLNKLGIDFRELNNFKDHTFSELPAKHGVPLTKHGVTFTALESKGLLLAALLKYNSFSPKKIIFIDDKLCNLESVASTCENLGIPFIGIQYLAVIKSNKWEFNEKLAHLQFKTLEKEHRWLSDQEAQRQLNTS